jgi:hypothetical protein
MKVKKEYSVLIVVILALFLYLILRSPDRTHYQLPKIPPVARTDISKVEISKADRSIVLNKKDDSWYIAPQGYPADTGKVNNMLDVIKELTLTALVSESKNYNRYNINDDNKITIKAWTGNTLRREFEVGKVAISYRHTFVKLAGDHRVYHARGNFRDKFDYTADNLRDKAVTVFEKAEIQEIHIAKGRQVVVFHRKQVPVEVKSGQEANNQGPPPPPKSETTWLSDNGKKGDESKLDRLLTTLSNLRCEKYIDNRKKHDFTNPIYTLQLNGLKEHTLSIFAKMGEDTKHYPAISSENDYPFLLSDWQANKIMIDPDEMLKNSDKS